MNRNADRRPIYGIDNLCGKAALHFIYHGLTNVPTSYAYALGTEAFDRQAELFARIQRGEGSSLRPELTFDDGHSSDHEFALPILTKHGLTAQFFITAGWTGTKPGYMGWPEVRDLVAAGQSVGAHGWSHRLLTHCSSDDLKIELIETRCALEDKLGCAVTTMSLPGGRYNKRVLAACRNAGYTRVFTSDPRVANDPNSFLAGRINVHAGATPVWLDELLASDGVELRRVARRHHLKSIAKTLMGDRLYGTVWRVANRGSEDERLERV